MASHYAAIVAILDEGDVLHLRGETINIAWEQRGFFDVV
jgi:hypothetical protein